MAYKVTIGIPVYNVEKYIRRMIDSALAQTFESIEFLVLDDCGTDGSMELIREYQRNHSRGKDIRIVRQSRNLGIGNGRNRIIDEAQGQYLYFLDSDDEIAIETIELLYRNAKQYNAQIVYGSYERIEEFGNGVRYISYQYPSAQFLSGDDWAEFAYQKYDRVQAMIWNCLIDIDVLRRNNLRFQPIHYWEDFLFTMDLSTYINCAVLLPDITYYYYCREGTLSHFQKRDFINKDEIVSVANAVEQLKAQSSRLRQKSYFAYRMYKLMSTEFYIVTTVLRHQKAISPSFSNSELREMMRSPLTFGEILCFRHARLKNIVLYLFGILPPSLSVFLMKLVGKIRGLL